MYGNFIYFILVLLIYSTYLPPEKPYIGPGWTFICFFFLLFVFLINTRGAFKALVRKLESHGHRGLHGSFDRIFTRQAILAIVMFSIDVYVLNLKLFVIKLPVFSSAPTLIAILFIALFTIHLAIIWFFAYKPYGLLFQTDISRKTYIVSNIVFHFPVILPWILISTIIDIIDHLPFESPRHLLARPEAQVVFFSLFLIALIIVAPSLMRIFWQCRPLSPSPKRDRIEAMCKMAGLQYNNILKWPIFEGRLLTAGVMGLVKHFRYILVTESLLQILNDSELDAVVAHEIGHIKKKHLLFYLVFLLGFIVLSYAAFDLLVYAVLYGNVAFSILRDSQAQLSSFTSLLFTATMAAILLVYFRFVFGYFMRNCERQADLYALGLLGNSDALVSSLEKIAVHSGQSHDRPSWHHFSIRQRIDFLKKCDSDRRWIVRHNRKLRISIAMFIIGMVTIGYTGYSINFGEMGNTLNSHFLQKVLDREIEQNPGNPKLYNMLASLYYEEEAYDMAIANYTKAIALSPVNAEAINNLAWIFATCKQQQYRNPVKALWLSKQAAGLKPEPHILDTLAESYFVNGDYEQAITTINKALDKNPKDRKYYIRQLQKFKRAAGLDWTVNGEQ